MKITVIDCLERAFEEMVDVLNVNHVLFYESTTEAEQLKLYGLYKQATEGPPPKRVLFPDMLRLPKHVRQRQSWCRYRDLSPTKAKVMYLETILLIAERLQSDELVPGRWGDKK